MYVLFSIAFLFPRHCHGLYSIHHHRSPSYFVFCMGLPVHRQINWYFGVSQYTPYFNQTTILLFLTSCSQPPLSLITDLTYLNVWVCFVAPSNTFPAISLIIRLSSALYQIMVSVLLMFILLTPAPILISKLLFYTCHSSP